VEEAFTSSVLVEAQPKPKRKRMLLKWSLFATALLLTYFMWQFGSGFIAGAQLSGNIYQGHLPEHIQARERDRDIYMAEDSRWWPSTP
jgi:hypothetical protein